MNLGTDDDVEAQDGDDVYKTSSRVSNPIPKL